VKRRFYSVLLCIALLACTVLPQYPALAASNLYFMAVNEKIYPSELNDDTIPIIQNSLIYVPYRLFDSTSTGVDLGSYCIYNQSQNILVIYTRDLLLNFNLNTGSVTDRQGAAYSFHAITRNSGIYVPVTSVAAFFGFQCATSYTEYGSVVRVTNSQAVLSDDQFASSASGIFQIYLNDYVRRKQAASDSQNSGTSTGTDTSPSSPVTPPPSEDTDSDTAKETIPVYLAFLLEDDTGLDDLLTMLSRRGLSAVFFVRPEDLSLYDDQIRAIIGTGNQIGFLVTGTADTDADTLLSTLESGNTLLRGISMLQTHFLLADGISNAAGTALEDAGWLCWKNSITVNSTLRLSSISASASQIRLTFSISSDAAIVTARALNHLSSDTYTVRPVRETAF